MAAAKSGISLTQADIPVVLGMIVRDDRRHDIAAWFGVNQGRIAEAQAGKYGSPDPAPGAELPPSGPPGIKGRRLREAANDLAVLLQKGDVTAAKKLLDGAMAEFDANEL